MMRWRTAAGLCLAALLTGCSGPQSAFSPAGTESARVLTLFWVMLGGAVVIWLIVIGIAVFVTRVSPRAYSEKAGIRLIIWGGCVFPTVVLAGLLV